MVNVPRVKSLILHILLSFSLAGILLILGCSTSKKNFFSKTWHNTTAHYNSYFIANEDIALVEATIAQSHKNNYSKILGVFYDIDSATIDGVRDKLEDVIKKASLPIQNHDNSDWVYPSYYLIGKARYYGGDFVNAIETFKYINKNGEEDDIRQKALVALMRAFIDYNEHSNAVAVADYLRKERLTSENQLSFLMTKAYLFQVRGDYDNMVRNLSEAVELQPKKKDRARLYFILGQVYQKLGFDGEAYNNFRKCLKSNPEYELSFYAKLNLAQVTKLDQKVDLKQIRGYFKKLLKDDKNAEFVDRIYYEMANFELKHQNPDDAVTYLKASLATGIENPRQKGLSYLKLGEMNYEMFKNYHLAQAYYDSAVNTLPQEEENFAAIKERSEILTDFVTQLTTIHDQDSLLAMSEMSKADVQVIIEKYIADQDKLQKEKDKEAKRIARENAAPSGNDVPGRDFANPFGIDETTPTEGESWYFYNLSAVATGRTMFTTNWGKRPLEDNWRRSQKRSIATFTEQEVVSAAPVEGEEVAPVQEVVEPDEKIAALVNTIPYTPEAKAEAYKKLEEAYFKLGNIYHFQLNEKQNAISTYDLFLARFPDSELEPEVLYMMYLIFKTADIAKSDGYKDRLISKYPTTIFAKLAENPNYREENNETAIRLQRLYKIAYEYYSKEDFNQARLLVSRALEQYPDNEFIDQLKILQILIDGKLEGQDKYQYELQKFIDNNPDSRFKDYANTLLTASREFSNKELQRKGAQYMTYFDQPHFFILIYPNVGGFSEIIPALVEHYIDGKYPSLNLKTGNLILNEGFSLVLVNRFGSKAESMDFFKDFTKNGPTLPELENMSYEKFVITEDNFQIFYQTKKIEDYKQFFEDYYRP